MRKLTNDAGERDGRDLCVHVQGRGVEWCVTTP